MPKYFMSHTNLAGMERMMMNPDRTGGAHTQRRKGRPREKPRAVSAKKGKEGAV